MVMILHFFIIYVLAQQPQNQLQIWHGMIRKMQKYKHKCQHIKMVIKITPKNTIIIVEWTVL